MVRCDGMGAGRNAEFGTGGGAGHHTLRESSHRGAVRNIGLVPLVPGLFARRNLADNGRSTNEGAPQRGHIQL